ncbi:hypothetical protein T492DRAFT_911821 [Pavlovales sp. CCMP2436]|nr:hypothetical protein T492DRAFT_911821 [Pavlovales sp. CCMP2436]
MRSAKKLRAPVLWRQWPFGGRLHTTLLNWAHIAHRHCRPRLLALALKSRGDEKVLAYLRLFCATVGPPPVAATAADTGLAPPPSGQARLASEPCRQRACARRLHARGHVHHFSPATSSAAKAGSTARPGPFAGLAHPRLGGFVEHPGQDGHALLLDRV